MSRHADAGFSQRLGERIREARERLRMTQQQLAQTAEFAHFQTISDIERGTRDLKAVELTRLARALKLSLQELLEERLPRNPIVLWRQAPPNPEPLEAAFLERCRQYRLLEEVTGQIRDVPIPSFRAHPEAFSLTKATAAGEHQAQALELGARPAVSLAKVLEDDYGIKIWYEDLGENGSGCSVVDSFGAAMLINAREPRWRRHFSIGHELFHLLTWEDISPQSFRDNPNVALCAEKWANAFASALLLPKEAVRAEIEQRTREGRVAVSDLIDVARQYQVSTEALLWRLVNLGWLSKASVEEVLSYPIIRSLDTTARKNDRDQPIVPPERFVRLAHLAYVRGDLSRARLAEMLSVDLIDLDEKIADYGLADGSPADVPLASVM